MRLWRHWPQPPPICCKIACNANATTLFRLHTKDDKNLLVYICDEHEMDVAMILLDMEENGA